MLVIPIFLPHRGCPHDCLFCNQQKISGEKGQGERAGAVPAVIEEWLPRAKHNRKVQVAFFGGSFTCQPFDQQQRYLAAVQPYVKSGEVNGIRISTRPDCITSEIIEILKRYQVETVELGVQSFDETVLQKSLRGHDSSQSIAAFQLLRKSGMQVGMQLMVGLPGETRTSFMRGIRKVCLLRPDLVRLYPVVVVRESGLARRYLDKKYKPLSLPTAIAITARAAEMLIAEDIKIVRIGLQPSEELEASVLAGPYHPAFGELVRSRVWFRRIRAKCSSLQNGESLAVSVSHRDMSAALGHKRANIQRLNEIGYSKRIKIVADKDLPQGTVHYAVS